MFSHPFQTEAFKNKHTPSFTRQQPTPLQKNRQKQLAVNHRFLTCFPCQSHPSTRGRLAAFKALQLMTTNNPTTTHL